MDETIDVKTTHIFFFSNLFFPLYNRTLSTNFTHFIVRHEASFVRVFAGFAATTGRGSDVELGRVDQGETTPVGGHTDHELLLGGALLYPFLGAVLDCQFLLVTGGA